MPREPKTPAVDWRAEAHGRAAFEAATAEAKPTAAPPWWESPKEKEVKQ